MKLSIIIPTYNEERTIEELIRKLLAVPFPVETELIVVDDGSRDRTFTIEQAISRTVGLGRIQTVRNPLRQGKGASIREGLRHAAGEWIVIQDGDLEYDPAEIPALLAPLLNGTSAVVYGSRFLRGGHPEGMAWPNLLANRALTGLTNRWYGLRLTDMETCYKVLPRAVLGRLNLAAHTFEFEPEVTAKLARAGVSIQEVPISYRARNRSAGKKIGWKDFFIALRTLWRYRRWGGDDRSA